MGELYNKMARDLALKNLAATTQKEYLRCCCHFVRYHMTSPKELGETAIKQYLEHLRLKGAGPETLKMNVAALKFLYEVTLDRPKVAERLPWPKVPHRKPDILSMAEYNRGRRGKSRRHVSSIKRALRRAGYVVKKSASGRWNNFVRTSSPNGRPSSEKSAESPSTSSSSSTSRD